MASPVNIAGATAPNQRRTSKAVALVVPIVLLLLVQWPMRAWVDSFANYIYNTTQILFGVYAAFAITAASRANSHLAFVKYHSEPHHTSNATHNTKSASQWRTWARLACVAPWAILILWTSVPQTWESLWRLEQFREGGFAHGFFLLRLSVVLLVGLVLVNAVADIYFTRQRQRQSAS